MRVYLVQVFIFTGQRYFVFSVITTDFERACALPEDFGSPSKHLSLSSLPSDLNTSFTSINFILDTSSLSHLAEETETRGPEAAVISELMHRVRATFLEIVRHIYWEHIREGKIPRDSSAAMALLFSIDTAMDSIRSPGLQDWNQVFYFLKCVINT